MTTPILPGQVPPRSRTPMAASVSVFITVFLITMIIATAITFILPESFASRARVKVTSSGASLLPTELEVLQSQAVLDKVIEKLNLNETWGRKYLNGETLKTAESVKILKERLNLAPLRNTSIIGITVYSEDRREAAEIANTIAGSYRAYSLAKQPPATAVEIIDPAQPAMQPCKPNKPLNLALGAVAGLFLGAAVASVVAFPTSPTANPGTKP